MNLQQAINEKIKTAMKSGDSLRLNVYRSLKSAISNAALQSGNINAELPDDKVLGVIRKALSQREDSFAQFTKGGRVELAQKEKEEMEVLKEFLPATLSDEQVDAFVKQAVAEIGATTKKDFGKLMKRVSELCGGAVDNKTLSLKIGQLLN